MFEQVEAWWANSTDQLICCHARSSQPDRRAKSTDLLMCCHARSSPPDRNRSELQSDIFAAFLNTEPDETKPTRSSSAPEHSDHLQSIALRKNLHKLDKELAGVDDRFAHVFDVPPCSIGFPPETYPRRRSLIPPQSESHRLPMTHLIPPWSEQELKRVKRADKLDLRRSEA